MSAYAMVTYGEQEFRMAHPSGNDCILGVWRDTKRFYEHDLIERVVKRAVSGVYMDVGANVGNHAIAFAALCPSTEVVCIEPLRAVHDALLENMTAHGGGKPWLLVPLAVGSKTERVHMEGHDEQNMGRGQTRAAADGDVWCVPFAAVYALFAGRVAVLKLDIEGGEMDALRQIGDQLRVPDAPRLIAVERTSPEAYAECDGYLRAFGYECDGVDLAKPYAPVYLWERMA